MGLREYARYRGVTHRAVQKALRAGRITAAADGRINVARADALWSANTRPRVASPGAFDSEAGQAYAQARIILEHIRAKREKLEYEVESGVLISADKVRADTFALARRVRDRVLAIPARLAPVLAAISDPAECERLLAAEMSKACEELGGGTPR
jgi:hypothetical protein